MSLPVFVAPAGGAGPGYGGVAGGGYPGKTNLDHRTSRVQANY